MTVTKDALIKVLRRVRDPEIPVNVYDLGLIYDLAIDGGAVRVRMTLTAPNCPMAEMIVREIEQQVRGLEGVESVAIDLVWEPKWEPAMMSEAAKLDLEFTGHTGPPRRDPFSPITVRRAK